MNAALSFSVLGPHGPQQLASRLRTLRQAWAQGWVGLPAVLLQCQRDAGLLHPGMPGTVLAFNALGLDIARRIEAQALALSPELAYHNRLHFADVMVVIAALLSVLPESGPLPGSAPPPVPNTPNTPPTPKDSRHRHQWASALLCAAAAHDVAHTGHINQFPHELELRTWEHLASQVDHSGLPGEWVQALRQLILLTDFQTTSANHSKVADRPFAWDLDWAVVLLNEADTWVSASAEFGPELSQSLQVEWQTSGVALHSTVNTPQGRLGFLKSLRFSSPAAHQLGITDDVRQQM